MRIKPPIGKSWFTAVPAQKGVTVISWEGWVFLFGWLVLVFVAAPYAPLSGMPYWGWLALMALPMGLVLWLKTKYLVH